MRTLVLSFIALTILFSLSCKEKEAKRIDMNQVAQFEDSIPHIIPGTRSIHTLQKEDEDTKFSLIVGSPGFYAAADDKKQAAAIRAGIMVMHVLGPDNSIESARLVLTQKDNDEKKIPDDGIILDMKIDSLKKVLYPAK